VLLLDLQGLAPFTDFFVIATCLNPRHAQAVAEEADKAMDEAGFSLLHREGTGDSGWVLLDFGDVIVHLFTQPTREHYGLEHLWSAAPTVVRIQ
jgi:ribosome-associated protein